MSRGHFSVLGHGEVSPTWVVAGGEPPSATPRSPPARVIAADGGLAHAYLLGLDVDDLVGDLDSVAPADLARARAAGTRVHRYPPDKDATDLELALALAATSRPAEIVVIGAGGGRLDHLLGGLLLLAADRWLDVPTAGIAVTAYVGTAVVTVVRDRLTLDGAPGETISLLPVGGPARGVHTTGLRFPLHGEDLAPGTSRGVSNVVAEHRATVSVGAGTLLAVRPGGEP